MKPAEAAKAVAMLQAAYPAARWSEPTVALYELMLADLEVEVVSKAIDRIIRTSKFLPTVAEILDAAVDVVSGPARGALDAWSDVTMAIRRDLPRFKDPLVEEAVRIMGWSYLSRGDTPESVDRARFCELYQDLQRKQRARQVTEPGGLQPAAETAELQSYDVQSVVRRIGSGGRS